MRKIAAFVIGRGWSRRRWILCQKCTRTPDDLVPLWKRGYVEPYHCFHSRLALEKTETSQTLVRIMPRNGELAMNMRELFLQGCCFTISCLTLLLLLAIAVHFPVGRVLFAVLVSVICVSAECFALFKMAQNSVAMEQQSGDCFALVCILHPSEPSAALLTETKN